MTAPFEPDDADDWEGDWASGCCLLVLTLLLGLAAGLAVIAAGLAVVVAGSAVWR